MYVKNTIIHQPRILFFRAPRQATDGPYYTPIAPGAQARSRARSPDWCIFDKGARAATTGSAMTDDTDKHPDKDALFREAMAGVRPLRHDGATPYHRRPAPEPAQTRRDQQQVLQDMLDDSISHAEMETGDELVYARPGLQHGLLRKLRRGQFSIEAELDLHGMTTPEAHQGVATFLGSAIDAGKRVVRIIHGKGHGSFNKQPVLKGKVAHWLQRRDEVLAFCSARPVDGGTGAIYVLLRRRRS